MTANAATTSEPAPPGSEREYYPLRMLEVAGILAFWAFLGVVSAAGRQLDPRVPGLPEPVVSAVVTATYVEYALWAMITIPTWWLATRYSIEGGRRLGRVLLFVALGIVIAFAVDRLLLELRQELLTPLSGVWRPPPPIVGLGVLDDLMVYFAVLGSGVARDYFLRYRTRLEEMVLLEAQLAQARLDTLRARLDPHFLFNTLNAISALVERDPRGTRRMIARLSDLLRHTLEGSNEQEVPLGQELEILGEYVDLMQIRFQGKLDVTFAIEDDVGRAVVPNLILQPIVENAFKHGIARITGHGRVGVRVRRAGEDLLLTVTDNGPGPDGGAEGVGLATTAARLQTMYGPRYGVVLRPASGGGAEAEVVLPYHEMPWHGALAESHRG